MQLFEIKSVEDWDARLGDRRVRTTGQSYGILSLTSHSFGTEGV